MGHLVPLVLNGDGDPVLDVAELGQVGLGKVARDENLSPTVLPGLVPLDLVVGMVVITGPRDEVHREYPSDRSSRELLREVLGSALVITLAFGASSHDWC